MGTIELVSIYDFAIVGAWQSRQKKNKGKTQMQYQAELTDTFGGEANYSWVKRASFTAKPETNKRELVRKAKKLLGLHGRHKSEEYGEMIKLTFGRDCIVAFITW